MLLASCAEAPRQPEAAAPPVYPPPPAEPRFVFERSLSFADNVEVETFGDRLRAFAVGSAKKPRGLVKPYGVAVHRGRVYVTDTVQKVVAVFDIPGQRYFEFGHDKPGEIDKPIAIAVAANGEVYVADVSARRVKVYDGDGHFLRLIGSRENLSRPTGVALSPDDATLYVVDVGGIDSTDHHVQVFDAHSGALLRGIGTRGEKPGEFNFPVEAAAGPDGILYVLDKMNFRVQSFTPDGVFVASFGKEGRFPGQFASPRGIATDRDGHVYVVDTAFGNVQIFDNTGQLLMFMGERGQSGLPGKYMLPAGVTVDEDGRVYLVDQFFRKVDIYRPVALNAAQGFAAAPPQK